MKKIKLFKFKEAENKIEKITKEEVLLGCFRTFGVFLITIENCPECKEARELLQQKKVLFYEVLFDRYNRVSEKMDLLQINDEFEEDLPILLVCKSTSQEFYYGLDEIKWQLKEIDNSIFAEK